MGFGNGIWKCGFRVLSFGRWKVWRMWISIGSFRLDELKTKGLSFVRRIHFVMWELSEKSVREKRIIRWKIFIFLIFVFWRIQFLPEIFIFTSKLLYCTNCLNVSNIGLIPSLYSTLLTCPRHFSNKHTMLLAKPAPSLFMHTG